MSEKTSKWADIRADYIEESGDFHVLHIDAWKSENEDEEGTVIAKLIGINKDNKPHIYLSYQDGTAMIDNYAQEVIKEGEKTLRVHLEEQIQS